MSQTVSNSGPISDAKHIYLVDLLLTNLDDQWSFILHRDKQIEYKSKSVSNFDIEEDIGEWKKRRKMFVINNWNHKNQ